MLCAVIWLWMASFLPDVVLGAALKTPGNGQIKKSQKSVIPPLFQPGQTKLPAPVFLVSLAKIRPPNPTFWTAQLEAVFPSPKHGASGATNESIGFDQSKTAEKQLQADFLIQPGQGGQRLYLKGEKDKYVYVTPNGQLLLKVGDLDMAPKVKVRSKIFSMAQSTSKDDTFNHIFVNGPTSKSKSKSTVMETFAACPKGDSTKISKGTTSSDLPLMTHLPGSVEPLYLFLKGSTACHPIYIRAVSH
ncbi:hypothetical protein BCR37DRAFT_70919 [Protomyces lactucae-debilis]|uniref:Uncharacterized protein n=1 Tax=Protomyces lactucae-debilis TaxID=2754530 RepID=A0A1Y2FAV7_PROLT|nr:uncharacterized protein BCR37DRAFT_70919 [Protomyces lactucae-debilis]ORY80476.1 hypothetical protein BCR37DRAFT_70919 [Protomyces lactucae-debilis]